MKAKISRLVLPVLIMAVYVATATLSVKSWCPPKIQILTPCSTIYATASVPLTFTVNKAVSWIGYTLDGQANVTILGNTTLTTLQEGTHHVVVYANDTCGLMGTSDTVYFSVDTLPPEITDIRQFPSKDSVYAEDEVMVNATVTDDVSGVKSVSLFYAYANSSGIWISVMRNMTKLEGNVWSGTLPKFPYGTNVTYTISAEDNVGNSITTAEMGYDIQYHIIPEFSTFLELSFFAIATIAMIIFQKRRRLT
ncbi:MAG TPA: hypothetical protein VMT01_04080 [Candidatus Acidoferrum sp.]|jgi:hypothetical protein|nr:hypothetical protein [Candidatus Acidoferrum sp.]